jgi:hypothetical protein
VPIPTKWETVYSVFERRKARQTNLESGSESIGTDRAPGATARLLRTLRELWTVLRRADAACRSAGFKNILELTPLLRARPASCGRRGNEPRTTPSNCYLPGVAGDDGRLHLIEWSDVRARLNRKWSPCESSSSFGGIGRVPQDVIAKDEYPVAYSAVVAGWYGLNL